MQTDTKQAARCAYAMQHRSGRGRACAAGQRQTALERQLRLHNLDLAEGDHEARALEAASEEADDVVSAVILQEEAARPSGMISILAPNCKLAAARCCCVCTVQVWPQAGVQSGTAVLRQLQCGISTVLHGYAGVQIMCIIEPCCCVV
jgi:hypothetical protein